MSIKREKTRSEIPELVFFVCLSPYVLGVTIRHRQTVGAGGGSGDGDFLAILVDDFAALALQAFDREHVELGTGHAHAQIAGRERARRGDAEFAVVKLDQCRRMDFLAGDLVDAVAEVDAFDFRFLVDIAALTGHPAGVVNVGGRCTEQSRDLGTNGFLLHGTFSLIVNLRLYGGTLPIG